MTMHEEFDRPLNDYSRFSTTGLAQIALYRLSRLGLEHLEHDSGPAADPDCDSFRLTSWVEPDDDLFGNALGISLPHMRDGVFMSALLYKVNRDEREILDGYPKTIDVPQPIERISDLKSDEARAWASDLTLYFDRSELETSVNMLYKAAVVFYSNHVPGLDKYVNCAVADSEVYELARRYPGRAEEPKPAGQTGERQHIAEWSDFTEAAGDLLARETNPEWQVSYVNVRKDVNGDEYYIKLAAEYGKLSGAQILCDRGGNRWQSQLFDLRPDQPDDVADFNIINGMWDREAILASLSGGETIGNGTYEYYRSLAEQDLTAVLQASASHTYLRVEN